MFCMNCGMELPDKAKFCLSCGAPQIGTNDKKEDSSLSYLVEILLNCFKRLKKRSI